MRSIKAAAALLGSAVLAALLVGGTTPALAAPAPTLPSLTLDNFWAGGAPSGFLPPAPTPVNLTAYPTSDPTGWNSFGAPSAAVANFTSPTGETFHLYCLDILTSYNDDYVPGGSWDGSGVANLGYVSRLLQDFFPNTDQPTPPASIPSAGQRAWRVTVVQTAIWYFTNNFVVQTGDAFHDAVAAVVNQVLAEGPADEPSRDLSFSLSGPSNPVHAGSLAGPFSITTSGAQYPYTITAAGGQMYSDSKGKHAVANGATVPAGTKIWVRRDTPGNVMLTVQGSVEVPIGIFYASTVPDNPLFSQPMITAVPVGIPAEAENSVSFDAAPTESASPTSSSRVPTTPATSPTTATTSHGTSPIAETGTQAATLSLIALTAIAAGGFMVFVGLPRRQGAHRR